MSGESVRTWKLKERATKKKRNAQRGGFFSESSDERALGDVREERAEEHAGFGGGGA